MRDFLPLLSGLPLPARPVIVDGGANKGRTVEAFRRAFPLARIMAFEPIPELARRLRKRFGDDIDIFVMEQALGETAGRAGLTVMNRPTLSSLLTPTGIRDKYADEVIEETARIEVEVVRLDAAATGGADIVKLDLQGFELQALRGATGILGRVAAVVAEVAFRQLYDGGALYPDIEAFLAGFGLEPAGLADRADAPDGSPVSADALFLRRGPTRTPSPRP